MANEVTVNISLAYSDSDGTQDSLASTNFLKTVATKRIAHIKQSITTSEVALNLGGISAPGFLLAINLDPTNFVSLRVASGGAKCAHLYPGGGPALIPLDSGMQVPYAIADTATCVIEFLVIST